MASLDPGYLRELRELESDGEPSLLAELIDAYLLDAARHLATLRAALAARDPRELERTAHTMKGASGSLGALRLSALYAEMQDLAPLSDWTRAAALLPHLEAEQAAAEAELRVERDRGQRP